MSRPEPVSVVVTGDDNAARGMAVALRSTVDTSQNLSTLKLYVLHQMSPATLDLLARSFADTDITFVDVAGVAVALPPGTGKTAHISSAMWLRIFMADALPEVTRAIYLDADTLVRRDLRELADIDLEGNAIGAVTDFHPTFSAMNLTGTWGDRVFTGEEAYFNSGVLLCDLTLWRSLGVRKEVLELVAADAQRLRFPDQDALNIVFANHWTDVGDHWNNRSFTRLFRTGAAPALVQDALDSAAIVHYATPYKPWRVDYPAGIGQDIWLEVETRTAFAGLSLEAANSAGWAGGVYVGDAEENDQ